MINGKRAKEFVFLSTMPSETGAAIAAICRAFIEMAFESNRGAYPEPIDLK